MARNTLVRWMVFAVGFAEYFLLLLVLLLAVLLEVVFFEEDLPLFCVEDLPAVGDELFVVEDLLFEVF